MKQFRFKKVLRISLFSSLAFAMVIAGCKKTDQNLRVASTDLENYSQVNLIANKPIYNAVRVDSLLQDAYGIAFSPAGNIWISSQVSGFSFVEDKEGNETHCKVAIPSPSSAYGGGAITGIVFNGTNDFVLPNNGPAKFIFAGADGIISGWNPANKNLAVTVINNAATAAYNGITTASNNWVNYIYAANIKAGTVDVFDTKFNLTNIALKDASLPVDYSPFDIKEIDGKIFVLYAKVDANRNQMIGAGFGIINIFKTDGSFVKRFVSNGELNAPWGITKAPNSFFGASMNADSNRILVGNFGDGHINVYSAEGMFMGALKAKGKTLVIDGLWGLSFAPVTATAIDPNRLYFEAGPKNETDGIFGYIKK